jgi:hypothetical protein
MKRPLLISATLAGLAALCTAACDTPPTHTARRDGQSVTAAAGEASGIASAAVAVQPVTPIVPVAGKPVLWGYVDGAGVAHFATTRLDSHYEQVLRETAGPRVLGKTVGTDSLLTWLEFSPDVQAVQPLVAEAAKATGVDQALLKAVITVESNYNARAVSPRGALGLMQLTPDTADRYATKAERQRPAAERMLDARTNILTGARMLADLTRRYGGIDVALAAWNAGEGTVRRAGGRMPAIAETEAHVHMVLELYWALLQRELPSKAHRLEVATCAPAACRAAGATAAH